MTKQTKEVERLLALEPNQYNRYGYVHEVCRRAVIAVVDVAFKASMELDYCIIINDKGHIETLVKDRIELISLAKNEKLLLKINRRMIDEDHLLSLDVEDFFKAWLERLNLLDYVRDKKKELSKEGLEEWFRTSPMCEIIEHEYIKDCNKYFLEHELYNYTTEILNHALVELYNTLAEKDETRFVNWITYKYFEDDETDDETTDNEEKRDMEKKNAYAKKLINEQDWDEVDDWLVGDIVDAAYYNDDNKITYDE